MRTTWKMGKLTNIKDTTLTWYLLLGIVIGIGMFFHQHFNCQAHKKVVKTCISQLRSITKIKAMLSF